MKKHFQALLAFMILALVTIACGVPLLVAIPVLRRVRFRRLSR